MTDMQLYTQIASLPADLKKEVSDFVEFLLEKSKKRTKKPASEYKKRILNVSTWQEKDIAEIENNLNKFSSWKVQQW